jgi:putative transposase
MFSPLVRPAVASINLIGAMIDKRKYAFMLKKGATKTNHMILFFEMLHEKLSEYFGVDYYKHTIFILDNARVHSNKKIKSYYNAKKLTLIGLPPYSPELNPIENLFNEIKQQIKLKPLVNKQFEYIIAETLQNLRSRIR